MTQRALFSKKVSSALTEFLHFWNPSMNSKVTIILVVRSLFEAVHGLQNAYFSVCIVTCTYSAFSKLCILPWFQIYYTEQKISWKNLISSHFKQPLKKTKNKNKRRTRWKRAKEQSNKQNKTKQKHKKATLSHVL